MATELKDVIDAIEICDTHEHMIKQKDWEAQKPDILCELFGNYVGADFVSAGASKADAAELVNSENGDVAQRFRPVADVWEAIRHTGYGEASRTIARTFCGTISA
ncbi:MAG: hypothetical protein IH985_04615 [Planctomycetes bacterium]|nr:hypothetical protein [Planctomycetota bacterium]